MANAKRKAAPEPAGMTLDRAIAELQAGAASAGDKRLLAVALEVRALRDGGAAGDGGTAGGGAAGGGR